MRALVAVALVVVFAPVAAIAGCAGSSHGSTMPERPVGEDLVALLPSGADGVVDVEVTQLDSWPDARRILSLLPAAGKQRLQALGSDPLAQIEALAIAIVKPGTPEAEVTIVARGQLDFDKLRAAMSDANEVEYHDARVIENEAGEAMSRVTPSVFAFGSRVSVRRVLDVAHKEDEGLRTASADAPLRQALARAPTAKLGRPAIMAALLLTPPLRERLRKDDWRSAAELDWIALSFAVGDGFDVGIVAGARSEADARDLADSLRARATSLRSQATVRLLGLAPYVEPFIVVAHLMEVHMAYRLSQVRVDALVTRMQQMQAPAPSDSAGSPAVSTQVKPGAKP